MLFDMNEKFSLVSYGKINKRQEKEGLAFPPSK